MLPARPPVVTPASAPGRHAGGDAVEVGDLEAVGVLGGEGQAGRARRHAEVERDRGVGAEARDAPRGASSMPAAAAASSSSAAGSRRGAVGVGRGSGRGRGRPRSGTPRPPASPRTPRRLGGRAAGVLLRALAADLLARGEHELDRVRGRSSRAASSSILATAPLSSSAYEATYSPSSPRRTGRLRARARDDPRAGRDAGVVQRRGVELGLDPGVAPAHRPAPAGASGRTRRTRAARRTRARRHGGVAAEHVHRAPRPRSREASRRACSGQLAVLVHALDHRADLVLVGEQPTAAARRPRPAMRQDDVPGAVHARACRAGARRSQQVARRSAASTPLGECSSSRARTVSNSWSRDIRWAA